MIFDPRESVGLQGQTGPHIQKCVCAYTEYTAKRKLQQGAIPFLHLRGIRVGVIKLLTQDPEVVNEAAKMYDPSQITNNLYSLAKSLNRYYHDIPILTSADDSIKQMRLYLIAKIAEVLETGMRLLGIEMPDRM